MVYERLLRPVLFRMDPENAHHLTFKWVERLQKYDAFLEIVRQFCKVGGDGASVTAAGITFPNPVGLAAGFDKNARLIPALEALGFGFVEVGSITAKPSEGNPKPRLFRLPNDQALINRMGLNNEGAEAIIKRLKEVPRKVPVGVNIAKTPKSGLSGKDAVMDYVASYKLALPEADYVMINISCPNTTDGKSFEDPDGFSALMEALRSVEGTSSKPLFVKFSADLGEGQLRKLLLISEGYKLDGYAAVNTSVERQGLNSPAGLVQKAGNGGLSGRSLREKARNTLASIRGTIGDGKPVISIGGIDDPEEAAKRLESGATLIQVYTGLIYSGPMLPSRMVQKLSTGN